MTGRRYFLIVVLLSGLFACKAEAPMEHKKPAPAVIIKPKYPVLTREERENLGIPAGLTSQLELAAGSEAEPFFVTVVVHAENMKGERGFEKERLAGFSLHTKHGDELITSYRAPFRAKGYLLFRSQKSHGKLNDIITVVKGSTTYDIVKIQRTEAPNYKLDEKAIIAWLKERQKEASFVITGAGPDWLEAQFTKPPRNVRSFAKKIVAFSPDVLEHGPVTIEKLVERMNRTNGFFLVWD